VKDNGMERESLLRRGLRLEVLTVGWNVIEAIVAIGAGFAAAASPWSASDWTVIESISGAALYHRLRGELRDGDQGGNDARERRALIFVGASFFLIAAYVLYEASTTLWNREAPEHSSVGIALAAVSLIVMPLVGWSKLRVAKALASRALAADAMETFVCRLRRPLLFLGSNGSAVVGTPAGLAAPQTRIEAVERRVRITRQTPHA
jgi:hypothetical protein